MKRDLDNVEPNSIRVDVPPKTAARRIIMANQLLHLVDNLWPFKLGEEFG